MQLKHGICESLPQTPHVLLMTCSILPWLWCCWCCCVVCVTILFYHHSSPYHWTIVLTDKTFIWTKAMVLISLRLHIWCIIWYIVARNFEKHKTICAWHRMCYHMTLSRQSHIVDVVVTILQVNMFFSPFIKTNFPQKSPAQLRSSCETLYTKMSSCVRFVFLPTFAHCSRTNCHNCNFFNLIY